MELILKRFLGKLAMISPGGGSIRPWLHKLRGVRIGENVWISQFVYIDELHPENVVIADNVTIGFRCTIFAHFYLGQYSADKKAGKVLIEKDVYIGPGCTILNDVTIGRGSVIVAGSVVTKNVPPGVLYGPVPAGPLARITHPLVNEGKVDYSKFVYGLRKLQPQRELTTNDDSEEERKADVFEGRTAAGH